jgi:predicted nucleotidyltransferase
MKIDLETITSQTRDALGENLVSIVLYGSHARGDASAGSDVNLFIVVRDHEPDTLGPLLKIVPQWMKKGVAAPVIFRLDQVPRSFDSFAIEFADMAAARRVLYGDDPFKDFAPDWDTVRKELEREARQKRVALSRRWLAAGGNAKVYPLIFAETVPGYFALLRNTLQYLKGTVSAITVDGAVSELAEREKWFKADVWWRLRSIARRQSKANAAELETLMRAYLSQAMSLVEALDRERGDGRII